MFLFLHLYYNMPSRKEMYDAIRSDYGSTIPDEWIQLVLDMYEKQPEYIERLCKDLKKEAKGVDKGRLRQGAPLPKTRLTIEEIEQLNKKAEEVQQYILEKNNSCIVKEKDVLVKAVEQDPQCSEAPLLE